MFAFPRFYMFGIEIPEGKYCREPYQKKVPEILDKAGHKGYQVIAQKNIWKYISRCALIDKFKIFTIGKIRCQNNTIYNDKQYFHYCMKLPVEAIGAGEQV